MKKYFGVKGKQRRFLRLGKTVFEEFTVIYKSEKERNELLDIMKSFPKYQNLEKITLVEWSKGGVI